MTELDFTDPFSDTTVGIVTGSLVVQGGAEEVARVLSRELNAPIYTMKYDPQRFDKDFREDVSSRIIRLELDTSDADDDFESFKLRTSPDVQSVHNQFDQVDYSRISADVLIATDIEAASMAYNSGVPYVTYIHHPGKVFSDYFYDMLDEQDGLINKLKFINQRWRSVRHMKNVAKASDKLLCNSIRTKERTKEAWKTPESLMEVAYPPVDTETYTPGEPDDLPVPMDRYFLAPQRLEPYKNINTLIEAAKQAREHLVLTGYGTMEDYVRRETQYSDYIHSLGYVDSETLADLLRGATAVTQGTLREDFGIVPVEGLAAGTPALVPASGGFLETIGDGYTKEMPKTYQTDRGLLLGAEDYSVETVAGAMQNFDPDDYADPETLAEYAQGYSIDAFVEKVTATLEDVYGDQL